MRLMPHLSLIVFGLNFALAINRSNFIIKKRITDIPARCTMHAIRHLFRPNTIVASILTPAGSQFDQTISKQLYAKILKSGLWSCFALKPLSILFNLRYDGMKPDYVIMDASSEMDVKLSVQAYMGSKLWMPDVSFLIVAEHSRNAIISEGWLDIFWYYAVNRIFLQTINKYTDTSKFWSLTQQYNPTNCSQPLWKYEIVGECNRAMKIANFIRPNKSSWAAINLNRCPLKIGVTHYPPFVFRRANKWVGIEIDLINSIAKYLNFTPQYKLWNKSEQWGAIDLGNMKNSTGLFRFLLRFEVDLVMGGIIPEFDQLAITEEAMKYGQDQIIWIIPVRFKQKSWQSIVGTIQTGVWAMLAGSLGMIIMASFLMMSISPPNRRDGNRLRRQWNLLFDLYQLFFSYPVARLPRTNFMRFLIAQWLFLVLTWNAYINSTLTSMLTHLEDTERVQTIDELFVSNYRLGVAASAERWTHSWIGQQFVNCNSSIECYARMAFKPKFASIGRRIAFNYEKNDYVDDNGRPLIGILRENAIAVPLVILFRKLSDRVNREPRDGYTIIHLKRIVPLMVVCIVICSIVFLGEILTHKLQN